MPTYQYRLSSDGRVVEARHGMLQEPETWGELCRLTGCDVGETAEDVNVERLISGGGAFFLPGASMSQPLSTRPGSGGSCCGVSGCHDR